MTMQPGCAAGEFHEADMELIRQLARMDLKMGRLFAEVDKTSEQIRRAVAESKPR